MRTSRKGRRRLEEAALFEEEGRKRWGGVAFRMTRRRRKKLAAAQDGEEPRLKRFVLQNLRMTRSRKRKMREEAAIRQTAQAASISALALLPPAASEAAALNTLNDIPAVFQALRDDRNRLRDFRAAKRNAAEAARALVEAEAALQSARQDKRNAERGLEEARQNLEKARRNLKHIAQELEKAQAESAKRTQEAIAAQQAVADFAPQVWQQETAVQQLQGQKQSTQAAYEALGRELGYLQNERDDLEERIRKAWESVDYAQNRLNDVIAMVHRAQAIQPEQHAKEARWQAYDSELEQLDAAVDEAEAVLDSLNSQLDALQDAQEAAEDAERDARELVKDLLEQKADGEQEVRDSETYVAEAEKWDADAAEGIKSAETYLHEAETWKEQADYELAHFGESESISMGMEYYSLQGNGQSGHQLYFPLAYNQAARDYELSLGTGYLLSRNGQPMGNVTGLTDTVLGVTVKNHHKVNDVNYKLTVNLPSGAYEVSSNAMMPDDTVLFTSFGEGFWLKPELEVKHRITEQDWLEGSFSWQYRTSYQYKANVYFSGTQGYQYWREDLGTRLTDFRGGNQFRQEFAYKHIGEDRQFKAALSLSETGSARQGGYVTTNAFSTDVTYVENRYRDGLDWNLGLWYTKDCSPRDSWQVYSVYNRTGKTRFFGIDPTKGDTVRRFYLGGGWQHEFDQRHTFWTMVNYMNRQGQVYSPWDNELSTRRNRWSVLAGYSYRAGSHDQLNFKMERYIIHDDGAEKYRGWNFSLMWNKSF